MIKHFTLGALAACFAFSLVFNYLFIAGVVPANLRMLVPSEVEQTDDQKLASIFKRGL